MTNLRARLAEVLENHAHDADFTDYGGTVWPMAELLADSELDRALEDAERYRWIRLRIQVRNMESMKGDRRPAITPRIGLGFLDSKQVPGSGYLDPARFEQECAELDTAIDAARNRHD